MQKQAARQREIKDYNNREVTTILAVVSNNNEAAEFDPSIHNIGGKFIFKA
jgi:hypothetical protein